MYRSEAIVYDELVLKSIHVNNCDHLILIYSNTKVWNKMTEENPKATFLKKKNEQFVIQIKYHTVREIFLTNKGEGH